MPAGTVQVAVVGAGPVGLTAAALLAARGVRVVLVERSGRCSDEPKAVSVDDQALRVYQSAGVLADLLPVVVPGTGTRYYDACGRPVFHAGSPSPLRFGYPLKNAFAQPELEQVLDRHLRRHPCATFLRRTVVRAVADRGDCVELRCTGDQGPVVIRARYCLGCDGGRSTVREQAGIGMSGRSCPEVWMVADVTGDQHDQRYAMHHADPERPHVIVPGRDGRCRYEFLLHPGEGQAGRPPDHELLRKLLGRYRSVTDDQIERAVNYSFHALIADRWRAGRLFLLGDAAHMMPPFAGQGLNSGIRDAANLAWKLADVLAGRLSGAALDSYEAERRPDTIAVTRFSERLGRIVMTTDTRLARRRDLLIQRALRSPGGRAFFEGMRYRPSTIYRAGLVVPGGGAPVGVMIGQPLVFDARRHRICRFDEAAGSGWVLAGAGLKAGELIAEAAALARSLAAVSVLIALDDRLPRLPETGPQPGLLADLDDRLDAEFSPYRGKVVLIRPDRFVAAAWQPGAAPDLETAFCLARPGDGLRTGTGD